MPSLTDDKPTNGNGNGAAILTAKQEAEIERNKWRSRRKMGAIALISMILVMFLLLFGPISESRIKTLEEPITWFFFSMSSVVGFYMGATAWASKKKGE